MQPKNGILIACHSNSFSLSKNYWKKLFVINHTHHHPCCFKAHANGRNKSQHCCVLLHGPKSLPDFKLYATSANKCQQVPTLLWFHANERKMLGPAMLRVVGQQSVTSICIGLHISLENESQ